MNEIVSVVTANLDYFILMLLRVSALIISSPIFGRKNVPNMLKIAFCVLVTYVLFAADPKSQDIQYNGVIEFAVLCIKELLFGLVLGFVTTLFFSLVQTAGQVMDMQMGFGMVNVFDVQSNISVPISGTLLNVILLIAFFGVNGHLQLIYVVRSTFTNIPVGQVSLNPAIGMAALEVFALAFLLAVNVAMPMIAAGLLGEVAMGFIVRAIPQMNVFVVGIPLKMLLGFLILLLIIPVYVSFSDVIFHNMFSSIDTMLAGLAP
jgi:flagellar biosynthetic protein FliR